MMSQLKVSSRHDITRAQQQAETAGRRIMANYPKTQSWIRGQLTTPIQDLLKSHGAFEIEATATIGQVHTKAHIEQWGAAQLVIHFDLDSTKPVVKRWRFLAPEHASQARSIEKSEDAIEIVTTNGDALFVPAGWTHQVVSECELAAVAFVVGALLGNLRCEKTLLHYICTTWAHGIVATQQRIGCCAARERRHRVCVAARARGTLDVVNREASATAERARTRGESPEESRCIRQIDQAKSVLLKALEILVSS
jgi:hypothetical protein